jgi:hypothetical protein
MKKDLVTVSSTSKVLAFTSLIALNAALPAEADWECYTCVQSGGQPFCLGGAVMGGHLSCFVHEDHCDMAGSQPCS